MIRRHTWGRSSRRSSPSTRPTTQVNPPELGILAHEIKKVSRGRAVVLPITDETRGHGTHSIPTIWGPYLEELLAETDTEN